LPPGVVLLGTSVIHPKDDSQQDQPNINMR
jgi:hypothetical protein